MAPKILSLPIEITEQIGSVRLQYTCRPKSHPSSYLQHLQLRDLKILRLVCLQLNLIFESQVLSTLVISITRNTLDLSTRQLKTLAWRKARATQLARSLKINRLSPFQATCTCSRTYHHDSSKNLYLTVAIPLLGKLR
jgi:hypothetical protein